MNLHEDRELEEFFKAGFSRREFIKYCGAAFAVAAISSTILSRLSWAVDKDLSTGSAKFPETIAALRSAYEMEMGAHHHYLRFIEKAREESYPKIAYLFTALAASEITHALMFKTELSGFEVAVREPKRSVNLLTTKKNLKNAATHELKFIDTIYPGFLADIKPEGVESSALSLTYAWESHKQHRAHINKLYKWSGIFFKSIARKFAESDVKYFVCRVCGSTITKLPPETCVICSKPVSNYSEIEED